MKRMHDKKQLAGGVTEEQFEELVRATPTDVRAVIDQDQIQLQMKHASIVLSIDEEFGKTINYAKWITKPFWRAYLKLDLFNCSCTMNGNTETLDIYVKGDVKLSKLITQEQLEELDGGELIADLYPFESQILIQCMKSDGTFIYYGICDFGTSSFGESGYGITFTWKDNTGQNINIEVTSQAVSEAFETMIITQYGNPILVDL